MRSADDRDRLYRMLGWARAQEIEECEMADDRDEMVRRRWRRLDARAEARLRRAEALADATVVELPALPASDPDAAGDAAGEGS